MSSMSTAEMVVLRCSSMQQQSCLDLDGLHQTRACNILCTAAGRGFDQYIHNYVWTLSLWAAAFTVDGRVTDVDIGQAREARLPLGKKWDELTWCTSLENTFTHAHSVGLVLNLVVCGPGAGTSATLPCHAVPEVCYIVTWWAEVQKHHMGTLANWLHSQFQLRSVASPQFCTNMEQLKSVLGYEECTPGMQGVHVHLQAVLTCLYDAWPRSQQLVV